MNLTKIFLLAITFILLNYFESKSQFISVKFQSYCQSATEKTQQPEPAQFSNPANLSFTDSAYIFAGLSYSRFDLPELTPIALSSALRLNDELHLGLNLTGLGGSLYNEFFSSLAFSYSFGKMLKASLSGEYGRVGIKDYGTRNFYNLNFGAILCLSENLSAGLSLKNFIGNLSSIYPRNRFLLAGLGYSPTKELNFDVSANVLIDKAAGFCFSSKYALNKYFILRLAVLTNPQIVELSVKSHIIERFALSINAAYHERLGFEKQLGMVYYF